MFQYKHLLQLAQYVKREFWPIYGVAILSWLQGFMLPVWPAIGLVLALVLGDLYTGINASKKKGEPFTSSRMRETIPKYKEYCIAIILANGVQLYVSPAVPFLWTVASVIALAEYKSISENIMITRGVDIWPSVKSLFKIYK